MKVFWIHVILLLPVYGEALYDALMWWNNKDDKPLSTWLVRPLLMIVAGIAVLLWDGVEWWRIPPVIFSYFLLLFPLLINWIRGESWDYVSPSSNKYDIFIGRFDPRLRFGIFTLLVVLSLINYYVLWN